MVGHNYGAPGADGTYELSWVTDVVGKAPKVTTWTAGKEVTISAKLGMSDDGNKVLPCSVNFPRQWFTMTDCKVNGTGDIVYTFSTQTGKKTADGKLVRLVLNYMSDEKFSHSDNVNVWYKFT